MPQVDLETLVSVCGSNSKQDDRRIAYEPSKVPPSSVDSPKSFCLSQDAERGRFDRVAVLERKGTTRGNSSSNSKPKPKRSKELPKAKMSAFTDVTYRRSLTGVSFFPRRLPEAAPPPMDVASSMKMSCMGRVRSMRAKRHLRHRSSMKESEIPKLENKVKKSVFLKTLREILRSTIRGKQPQPDTTDDPASAAAAVQNNEPVIGPAGLLGTKRFASGRKADSLTGDLDLALQAKDVVKSGPSDSAPLWMRGNAGPSRSIGL